MLGAIVGELGPQRCPFGGFHPKCVILFFNLPATSILYPATTTTTTTTSTTSAKVTCLAVSYLLVCIIVGNFVWCGFVVVCRRPQPLDLLNHGLFASMKPYEVD